MKINEKNLSTFAVTPPVDQDGYLNKRGEVNKAWQRRWFVLKGNLLFYFEKRGDKEPLGVIILEGCTIELASEEEDGGVDYSFKIIFHGEKDRSYLLAAETQTLMEKWMKSLTCAGYEYMKLMVAELQRQLEELEHSKTTNNGTTAQGESGETSARNGSYGQTSISVVDHHQQQQPKAPPRRHNPFNRPHDTATQNEEVTIRQKDFTVQRQDAKTANVVLLGTAAGPSTKDGGGGGGGAAMTLAGDEDEDRFSFGTLHAALGQSFVQDRLKRQQKEQEERMKKEEGKTSPSEVTTTTTNPGINANDECRLLSSQ